MRSDRKKIIRKKYQVAGAIFFSILLMLISFIGVVTAQTQELTTEGQRARKTKSTATVQKEHKDKLYYDVPLENEIQDYIFTASEKYNLPADLIIAVIEQESSYNQYAVGLCGEQGYMQIHPCNFDTLDKELGVSEFFDAKDNIKSGAYILGTYYNKYREVTATLMCYNCGETGAQNLWEQGIYSTEYSESVKGIMLALKRKGGT